MTLDWAGDGALKAQKVYTFRRGAYAVDLELKASVGFAVARRAVRADDASLPRRQAQLHVGRFVFVLRARCCSTAASTRSSSSTISRKTPVTQTEKGGWLAAIQHHFLAAAVPPADDSVRYTAAARGQDFVLSALGAVRTVDVAMPLDYRFTLFVGPKLQDQLTAAGPKLERAVDYGATLGWIARPLFWLLSAVERYVGNWGLAIVIVTFLIKLAFYRLTAASGRSMAKMRRVAAADEGDPRALQRRPPGAEPGDAGALQEGEGESRPPAACRC